MFCPIFRIHGKRVPDEPVDPTCGVSGGPNEIWELGDEAYAAITIRKQLRPCTSLTTHCALRAHIPTPNF